MLVGNIFYSNSLQMAVEMSILISAKQTEGGGETDSSGPSSLWQSEEHNSVTRGRNEQGRCDWCQVRNGGQCLSLHLYDSQVHPVRHELHDDTSQGILQLQLAKSVSQADADRQEEKSLCPSSPGNLEIQNAHQRL